jgi:hypothetical protein
MAAPQADDLRVQRRSLHDTDTDQHEREAREQIARVLTGADSRVLVQRSE